MTPPRRAFGASPSRGRYQRPGKASSAVSLVLGRVGFVGSLLIGFAVALLAGCAGPLFYGQDVPAGTPRDVVMARMGQPTQVVAIEGGERLVYSLQPAGQHAWVVDLDGAGRVAGSRQVLTETHFQRIVPGSWTRADVEREFGPPASIDRVGAWDGPIMTYRWHNGVDMFYWVYLDGHNLVQRAHPGMEFRNSPEWD